MNNQTDSMSIKKNQNAQKFFVFALMGLAFVGCMYLIFSPSSGDKTGTETILGFNTDVPMPREGGMIDDKREAYQQEQMMQRQKERMHSLQDFSAIFSVNEAETQNNKVDLSADAGPEKSTGGSGNVRQNRTNSSQSRTQSSIHASAQAYHDINRTLGSFYEQPQEQPKETETERLLEELETLKMQLDETANLHLSMDNQLELMEKSFQMAAKYMPSGSSGAVGTMGTVETNTNAVETVRAINAGVSGKSAVVPVSGVREQVVSALSQPMTNIEFMQAYSQQRNFGFYSADEGGQTVSRNTIRACIHDDQTVSDGLETQRNVRIRLIEPMQAGATVIPAHTIITGQARIGERLDVAITSIEYMGRIYPTEIAVYDVDGQRGIAIPPSMEVNALKEIAANAGTNMGTSITLNQSAGQQIAADLSRGAIQGTSQYLSRKIRVVKIHLKAGHQVFLLPTDSL